LVDCGIARVHHFGEENMKFELIHKEEHHDHLVCENCGRIIEFVHKGIEKFQKDIAKRHNFQVNSHELQLFGVCDRCRKKPKEK
jgi:Fur family ferric uptake transcriptional regulator